MKQNKRNRPEDPTSPIGRTPAPRANPVVDDPTYGGLSQDERVVMRQQIALRLDEFRATTPKSGTRTRLDQAPLQAVTSPFMSVVIPNYNGERFLPELCEALRDQTFRDFEVIFVDDASTDGSVAWVEAHYPEARVVVNRSNQGFAVSANLGASVARGKVFVLLNNDTRPEAEWLAELAKAICANPQAGIFASKVLLYDQPDVLHTTGDTMSARGLPGNRGVWERDTGQYDAALQVFGGCGCGSAFMREVWEALGGLDEDFWMYLEDVDFAFRAQLMGKEAVFVPCARILHHLTATAGGVMASYYVGRNTIWTVAKNMPRTLLLRNWNGLVGAQLAIAAEAMRSLRGSEARARLRGQVGGLLTLGKILRKRRVVQARRILEDTALTTRFSRN